MNSRLPQELQTRKVASLPDDICSVVEDLILNKFDIPEVLGGDSNYDPLDPAQAIGLPHNMLVLTLSFGSGKVYRLTRIISLSMTQLHDFSREYMTFASGEFTGHPIFIELAKQTAHEIDKQTRKMNNSLVRQIEVEMNGYRDTITTIESLAQFMYNHYRQEELQYYAKRRNYTT